MQIVIPVHRNPKVREPVHDALGDVANISLLDPLDYQPMIWLLRRSHFVITDSGGLQEEVTALGKPVIVIRGTTERPESVEAGNAVLVGTDGAAIESWATSLLADEQTYEAMARSTNPYGDGHAAKKIVDVLAARSGSPGPGCRLGWRSGRSLPDRPGGRALGRRRPRALDLVGRLPELERRVRRLGRARERREGVRLRGDHRLRADASRRAPRALRRRGRRRPHAADWLVGRVQQRRLAARDGWDGGAVYLFDLGMISAGLQSFGRRVDEERYVAAGLELVDLLDRELAADLGPVSAYGPRSERTNWSTRGVVHLAKLVQASCSRDATSRPRG